MTEPRARSRPEVAARFLRDDRTAGLSWVDLLARALRHSPRLPGALCVGRADLFDEHEGGAASPEARAAVRICRRCPELQSCDAWFRSLSWPHRPGGVVAARYRSSPKKRRKPQEGENSA